MEYMHFKGNDGIDDVIIPISAIKLVQFGDTKGTIYFGDGMSKEFNFNDRDKCRQEFLEKLK